jgi:hypothetical protein
MIYALPGATFEAELQWDTTGLVGTLGVRIIDTPAGTTITARTTSGIAEQPAGSALYSVSLTAPTTAGTYNVFWDTGTVTPDTTAAEELVVTSTLPAIVSPTGSDLTTLSAVRSFLQKSDTNQDVIISSLITRASAAIQRYCQREFAPTSTGVTRHFEWDGCYPWLDLAPYDLRTITTVQINTDDTPTTVTSSQYRLFPYPNPDGVFTALRLDNLTSIGSPRFRNSRIGITGDWGFAAEVSAFSGSFNVQTERFEFPEALPSAVRAGLDSWRRVNYS